MKTLSINFTKEMIVATTAISKKLGLSRTEFIRKAVIHELDNFKKQTEIANIVKAYSVMKNTPEYLEEAKEIIEGFEENE